MEANIAADPLAYPITLKIAACRHRVTLVDTRGSDRGLTA